MDVDIVRDGYHFSLHFERGENIGGLKKEPVTRRHTGTRTRWKPDLEVFTDILVPDAWFHDVLKRQAVVNPNLLLVYRSETEKGKFQTTEYRYENGIADYANEIIADQGLTPVQFWQTERRGRDREDKPEYKVKLSVAFAFSNTVQRLEYYHNSSYLEHGGSPDDAVKRAFVAQIDAFLRNNNRYTKNESKITFADVQDCLVLVSSSFSTEASYENQTKKAITNRFIYEAMVDFLKHQLEVYFTENPDDAARIAGQVLVERKFLVSGDFRSASAGVERIVQGYLCSDPARTVRVRIKGQRAFLTIKGRSTADGLSRYEWEKEIQVAEAEELLKLCERGVIEKDRYMVPVQGHVFEVDVFYGENEGLVMAELELSDESESFHRPEWLGDEVTGDLRYYNSMLGNKPYTKWNK